MANEVREWARRLGNVGFVTCVLAALLAFVLTYFGIGPLVPVLMFCAGGLLVVVSIGAIWWQIIRSKLRSNGTAPRRSI